MKKLFIAALALASVVACSKDGVSQLESSKKAVSITIANGTSTTRAVEEMAAFDTNDGGVGSIQDQATAAACAETDELVVLFANNAGTVEEAYSFAEAEATTTAGQYTYTWHNVSESVTQVAVVRYDKIETTALDSYKGTNLSVYQQAAANVDEMENIDITAINLYVAADLTHKEGDTCTVTDDAHNATYTYQLYKADVTIAPTIARVEITGIACDVADCGETDHATAHVSHVLGGPRMAAAQGQLVSGGYDELTLGTLVWGANDEYTYDLNDFVLKGIYAGNGNKEARTAVNYSAGEGKAITWNIDPTAAVPQIDSNPMTLDMVAHAYDYKVVNTAKNLTIGFGDAVEKFEAGKIYRMSINFGENNLDASNEAICVEVKVTVANWVVVEVTPEFGNN